MSASILEHLSSRPDDRVDPHKLYPLPEILLLVVCAVLGGAEGWEPPEEFGKETLDWLRTFAPFAHGIPSRDCIATVISRLRPKAFQSCFVNWTRAVAEANGGEVVAVDG
ncbi:ISAs1 family transposase, partial [Thiocapsa sp.]|uniref:ISAs1 family transposase n=1 Tax=Thiocapsa sp. TaxID=2024551 RepID=UPI003594577E